MSLFAELKRRNVFRVGAAYLVVAWLLVQVSDTLVPALRLPDRAMACPSRENAPLRQPSNARPAMAIVVKRGGCSGLSAHG
jgi:hypothetical protein